jgi:AraC-like DNA-binding protein
MRKGAAAGSGARNEDFRAWSVERISLECSENRPIQVDAFTYTEPQQAQFDMHYCLELGVVLRGRMDRQYRTGGVSYGPGQVWMCGMWEPHGWGITRTPTEVAVIFLHPPLLARLRFHEAREVRWLAPFVASQEDRPRISGARRAEVIGITRDILECGGRDAPLDRIDLHLKTLALLRVVMESWERAEPRMPPPVDLEPIGAAMELVFETRGFVPTRTAARACGLGRNSLSRLFVDYMGISFAEFAMRYRVSAAASQLHDTAEPVKAVASSWGFTDTSHFYRSFVKYYGCSPTDYRRHR